MRTALGIAIAIATAVVDAACAGSIASPSGVARPPKSSSPPPTIAATVTPIPTPTPPRVQMIDGFPIGEPVPCAEHCAEWTRLARAALDLREHTHVEIVGMRTFREGHIPDLYGPGVPYARSGTLNVVVFDLPDGSVRATGVYCAVGGCRGWTEFDFNVGEVVK